MLKKQSENSSLQIVEGQNRISVDSQILRYSNQIDDDNILDYSQEENSISFQVEEEKEQSNNLFNADNPQPKRKRRDIFAKYKKNNLEGSILDNAQKFQAKTFMKTFDEVFHLNQRNSRQPSQTLTSKFTKKSIHKQQTPKKLEETNSQISIEKILQNAGNTEEGKNNNVSISRFPDRISSIHISQQQNNQTQQLQQILDNEIFNNNVFTIEETQQIQHLLQQQISEIPPANQQKVQPNKQMINQQIKQVQPPKQQIKQVQSFKQMIKQQIKPEQKPIQPILTINSKPIYLKPAVKFQSKTLNNPIIYIEQKKYQSPNCTYIQTKKIQSPNNHFEQKPNKIEFQDTNIQSMKNESPSNYQYKNVDLSQSVASSVMLKENAISQSIDKSLKSPLQLNSIFEKTNAENLSNKKMSQQTSQQIQFPIYIRKAKKLNSYHPNLQHPLTKQNYSQITAQLKELDQQFDIALGFLEKIAKQIYEKTITKRQIVNQFQRGFKLEYFLYSSWEKATKIGRLEELQPRSPFEKRPFDYQKIQKAFQSYRKVIDYYKTATPNLEDQRGRSKYQDIRKKFREIQWNLKIISEDLYSHAISIPFPKFYYQFLEYLRKPFPQAIIKSAIDQRKDLLTKYNYLRSQNDALCCSQIGKVINQKLRKQLKYICPY